MSAVQPAGDFEHVVFEIAQGVWSDTGEDFFRSLVRVLSQALQADLVLVGALQPGGKRYGRCRFDSCQPSIKLPEIGGFDVQILSARTSHFEQCLAGIHGIVFLFAAGLPDGFALAMLQRQATEKC